MNATEVQRPTKEVLASIHAMKKVKGMIAVIDPDSGDYFLGSTLLEALKPAREKYPGKVFYSIRVGSPFAHEHKGSIGRFGACRKRQSLHDSGHRIQWRNRSPWIFRVRQWN